MTLCISLKHHSRDSYDQSFSFADSRITVVGASQTEKGLSTLPSTHEIKHQTDHGIKLHIVKSDQTRGRRDIVASVAGSVLLGLQSLIYLESVIQGMLGAQTFDRLLETIVRAIDLFWSDAHDKGVEYIFQLADDQNRTRIFELTASNSSTPELREVHAEQGIVLSVIGDQKQRVRNEVFSEINRILYLKSEISLEEAALIASIRAMRRETENPQNLFVGGPIQMVTMKGVSAYYVASQYKEHIAFRSAIFGPTLDAFVAPLRHTAWPIASDQYDPDLTLEEALAQ